MITKLLRWPALIVTGVVLAMIRTLARMATPWRTGRMLQSLSVPRMREHAMRTSLTVAGIAIGVTVLVAVEIINRSVVRGARATVEQVAGKADLQISGGTGGVDEGLLEKVRTAPGVTHAAPVLQQMVAIQDQKAKPERLLVLGLDFLSDDDRYFREFGTSEPASGRLDFISFANADDNLLLGHSFADRLGYKQNDKISLLTSFGVKQFNVFGFVDETKIGRAFGGAVAVMYSGAMQVAFNRGHNVDRFDVAVAPGTRPASVATALRALLGEGFVIGPPAQRGDQLAELLSGVTVMLQLASLVALVVGAFLIYNTMAISVVQRKHEIGTLRALGSTRRQIARLLTLEGIIQGAVGSALGIVAGVIMSRGLLVETTRTLDATYVQIAVTEAEVPLELLFFAFAAGIAAATLATAIPAWQASRISPALSMRTSGQLSAGAFPSAPSRSDWFGVAFLVVSFGSALPPGRMGRMVGGYVAIVSLFLGAVFLLPRFVQLMHRVASWVTRRWLNVETRLAVENLPRDLWRTSMTAATMMICAAMIMAVGIFVTSLNKSMHDWLEAASPGDLYVVSGTRLPGLSFKNAPLNEQLGAEIAAIPGVERIKPTRIVDLPFRAHVVRTVAIPIREVRPRGSLAVIEGGSVEEVFDGLEAGGVAVSENFASRFDVHAGDRIALSTSRGMQEFVVCGVTVDYMSEIGAMLMDRKTYVDAWQDHLVDTFEIDLRKDADAESVRRAIDERYGASYDLFVLTSREQRAEIGRMTEQLFGLVHVLELVAIVVAVLGILNSQAANVLDRIRELGVLRAMGMLRRQTRGLLIAEAILIGFIAVLAGIVIGAREGQLILSHVNVAQSGWRFPFHFPVSSAIEAGVTIVLATAVAAWYPARATAQLKITEALEYE